MVAAKFRREGRHGTAAMGNLNKAIARIEAAVFVIEQAAISPVPDPDVQEELEGVRAEREALRQEVARLKAERKELIAVVDRIANQLDRSVVGVRRSLERG